VEKNVSEACYHDDLAYIHDAGFGHFAGNAAPVLLRLLRSSGVKAGLVIDLGCGSGILAQEVVAAGYDVLGIDLSLAMIELAKQRVPGGRFHQGSFLTAELSPCIAVTAIGEIVNFLFDRANTKSSLVKLFRRVYRALLPGGTFLFDAAEPGRVPGGGPLRSYREGDDWAVLFSAEEDRRHRLLTREITSFRKVGDLYRRDHEVHRLRLYRRSELSRELVRIGFRVRTLAGYGKFRFPPGHVGFVAQRP
jgi:SAM-dependent methyltransferase